MYNPDSEIIKILNGKLITDVSINDYELKICFNELTILKIKAESNCWSHSFFEYDEDLKKNLSYKVFYSIEVNDNNFIRDKVDKRIDITTEICSNYGSDILRQTYFLDIRTSSGIETLIMHNDSNGYYGYYNDSSGYFSIETDSIVKEILK